MVLVKMYIDHAGSGNKTMLVRILLHFSAMINTESQCVTSAMQVTNAPSVVNVSAVG